MIWSFERFSVYFRFIIYLALLSVSIACMKVLTSKMVIFENKADVLMKRFRGMDHVGLHSTQTSLTAIEFFLYRPDTPVKLLHF